MSQPQTSQQKREFQCIHCNGTIAIPHDLPPTQAPCPHCGNIITSPGPPASTPPASAPAPAPAVAAHPTQVAKPAAAEQPAPAADTPTRKLKPEYKSPLAMGLLALLLLAICVGIGWAVIRLRDQQPHVLATIPANQTETATPAKPLRPPSWQEEAYDVLDKFLKGRSVKEKLPYTIPSPGLEERMNDRFGGSEINDIEPERPSGGPHKGPLIEDTPLEGFSTFGSTEEDRARGIYLLSYYRPAQFDLREFFRPVAPIEVEWGLQDADPLLALMANAENFTSESLSAMAFFIRTPDGLKIDWDTFCQTKYKTLETFLETPEQGRAEVFRVVLWEDVASEDKEDLENRTYHIVSPTGITGGVRVKVPVDSELGRKLSVVNWIGAKTMPNQLTRTATVELKWVVADGDAKVVINRLICWEFLGIGGKADSDAGGKAPSPSPAPAPAPPPASGKS